MTTQFNIGASGLTAYQEKLDVAANNIANIDTNAYKPQGTSFSDLMYTKMYANTSNSLLSGNGVKTTVTGVDTTQGGMTPTESKNDLAIQGDGWFAVETQNGNLYTRDGSFTVSVLEDKAYLVNRAGNFVLDAKGKKISAPIVNGSAESTLTDNVGVYTFADSEALTPVSNNCFQANNLSGNATALADSKGKILSGYLEQSGVSMPDEMVNLITAQRAYQISARVIQSADEISQTVNSLRV